MLNELVFLSNPFLKIETKKKAPKRLLFSNTD